MSPEDLTARLPALERDILHLHQTLRKTQIDIAKILGISQPTVNYHYKRAKERLDFLRLLPVVTSEEVRVVLGKLGAREHDIEAMALYVETNSQSEVARRMGTSQGAVRHWIHRAIVSHLQSDVSNDDVHKRVRVACSLLIKKPWIFIEATKTNGRSSSEIRLPKPPKTKGRWATGEKVVLLDGVFASLTGTVVSVGGQVLRLQLELESQDVTLLWSIA